MEIKINGIDAYYEVYGDGIPIIMLHGWGVDHRILKGCIEPIFSNSEKPFKRIYLDLPGMGKTLINSSVKSTDDMRDFILEFVEMMIPNTNYLLVGKSYGGYLSRGILRNDPNRISGIFQICPLVFCETQEENSPKRIVLEIEEGIESVVPKEEMVYFDLFHVRQTKEVWNQYQAHILPATKLANYDFLNNILEKNKAFKEKIDSQNNEYLFPAVMLAGRQDWCVGYTDLWKILEQYKRASYVVVDKAGHNLEYEQPDIFKTNFVKWLEDVEEYEKSRRTNTST